MKGYELDWSGSRWIATDKQSGVMASGATVVEAVSTLEKYLGFCAVPIHTCGKENDLAVCAVCDKPFNFNRG